MSVLHRSVVCDRVRSQISLGLDGELSQLESRMVARHLARCSDCAAFEADVVRVTHQLRSAPFEPLEHPISVAGLGRRRRAALASRAQIGIAAAVAVAVLGALTQVSTPENEPAFAAPTRYATSEQLSREVNQIIADGRAFSGHAGDAFPL